MISVNFLPFKLAIYNHYIFVIIPFILALLGIIQTIFHSDFGSNVYIDLTNTKGKGNYYSKLTKINSTIKPKLKQLKSDNDSNDNNDSKDFDVKIPLRIFQITDTHIGIFKTLNAIKTLCAKVVDLKPDFVFLTGDFYSLETRSEDNILLEALSPLKELKGKCFACLGNHEYEDGQYYDILNGLKENNIVILEDEETYVETIYGKIQILGARFYFSRIIDKSEHLFEKYKRNPDVKYHFTLLHNPMHFKYIKPGQTDLVFSGHLHG